jgi:hypothetical protein
MKVMSRFFGDFGNADLSVIHPMSALGTPRW